MTERKIAVVAIGGNSLIKDKQHQTVKDQYDAAKETAQHIAEMIEADWDVVIGHGNGPQVGFILRRSEIAHKVEGMHELPLDVCGADSQGAIGYALQQNLQNELNLRGMTKPVSTVITQVLVDKDDPAFKSPSKPIGSFMDQAEAQSRADDMGWDVVEDAGRGAVGGGGIPVIDVGGRQLQGTAAVIDKDFASSLLAQLLNADLLLISTAVEKVALNFGKPNHEWIDHMTLAEVKQYLEEGSHFAKGSMEPKMKAIVWFLESGGKQAIVTDPENIGRALKGETGTLIEP
jgi:carbamate kinase